MAISNQSYSNVEADEKAVTGHTRLSSSCYNVFLQNDISTLKTAIAEDCLLHFGNKLD